MRHLETIPDGHMEVETYELGNKRGSCETIRCASYTGTKEFYEEVMRVLKLRLEAPHWEPIVVRLVYRDFEHNKLEIV
jgi:hypothetical protein